MKMFTLIGAGVLALGTTLTATAPADAQRYGYGRHDGWHGGGHRYRPHRFYRSNYGYGAGRGYRNRRVVCRIHHGRYGPVRRCTRFY